MSALDHTATSTDTTNGVDTVVSTSSGAAPVGAFGSPMVAALEGAWAAIQARHPQVPAAVILVGPGSGGGAGLKLGHFAAMRWQHVAAAREGIGPLPEVFVGGEGLARGPADVLATLLHEAAHALAHVREVKDTSRQGRWHNAKFKALAEELGIEVMKDPRLGWSPTSIPDATKAEYAQVIEELRRALRTHRSVEVGSGAKTTSKTTPPAVCGCGRKVRVSRSVLAEGAIACGNCDTEFVIPDLDEDQDDDSSDGGA
ncbi:hypothetical protein [Pseudonocardia sp.]|uniref:hypothetical protein n=1 Tax=Pseudonocardia sp. TaxID=60912 RepID=UPI003D0F38ED